MEAVEILLLYSFLLFSEGVLTSFSGNLEDCGDDQYGGSGPVLVRPLPVGLAASHGQD